MLTQTERTNSNPCPEILETEIWDRVVEMALFGFTLTARLKEKFRYRIADKLQEAVLGFYLNIADGGAVSSGDSPRRSLMVARRCLLDTAYILTLLREEQLVSGRMARLMIPRLEELSFEIERFSAPS